MVGGLNSTETHLSSPVLQLYLSLTGGYQNTSFSLKTYGQLVFQGLTRFGQLIANRLDESPTAPIVSFEPFELNPNLVKIEVFDPSAGIKEAIEAVVKEEKKKMIKGIVKDRVKEDDLLNMSHLGMSLVTLSDQQNTSRDIIEPETPRVLDDNLLNFDNRYKEERDYTMKKLNNFEKNFDDVDFSKSNNQRTEIHHQGKRMFSGDKTALAVKTRPLSRQETIKRADPGKQAESEYCSPMRILKDKGEISSKSRPDIGKFTMVDGKASFGDFFGTRSIRLGTNGLQGPMVISNINPQLIQTGPPSMSREDSSSVRRAAEVLRRNAESTSQRPRGGSVSSQNNSIDNRTVARTENGETRNPKNITFKYNASNPGETFVSRGDPSPANNSELRGMIASKRLKQETPLKPSRSSEKSPSCENPADSMLTKRSYEIMNAKTSHKTIPTKYHPELFKLMDSKSKTYDFSDSQMGDSGVQFLSKYIRVNPEIDQLKLDNCKITDDGLGILMWSLYDIKIDKLYLRDNLITKEGLDAILRFVSQRKGLTLVNLKSNPVDKSTTASYIKEFSAYRVILLA